MQGQLKDWDLITDYDCGVIAAGHFMQYLVETQKRDLSHIFSSDNLRSRKIYASGQLDETKSELCETLRDKQNVVLFSGYWIRQEQQWAQEHYANTLNSR